MSSAEQNFLDKLPQIEKNKNPFQALSDQELGQIIDKLEADYNSLTPEQRKLLVQELQKREDILGIEGKFLNAEKARLEKKLLDKLDEPKFYQ